MWVVGDTCWTILLVSLFLFPFLVIFKPNTHKANSFPLSFSPPLLSILIGRTHAAASSGSWTSLSHQQPSSSDSIVLLRVLQRGPPHPHPLAMATRTHHGQFAIPARNHRDELGSLRQASHCSISSLHVSPAARTRGGAKQACRPCRSKFLAGGATTMPVSSTDLTNNATTMPVIHLFADCVSRLHFILLLIERCRGIKSSLLFPFDLLLFCVNPD